MTWKPPNRRLQPADAAQGAAAGQDRCLTPAPRGLDQGLDIGLLRQVAGLGLDPEAVQREAGIEGAHPAGPIQHDLELLEVGLGPAGMAQAAVVGRFDADRLLRQPGKLLVPGLVIGARAGQRAEAAPDIGAGTAPATVDENGLGVW
jgi:hypothetical protein